MDMIKLGAFLAALRREQGLTQAQLGEKLGVSNKTVSRWETGTYLPPVEMLQQLGELYGVSLNELLCGERLAAEGYREKAEENLRSTLAESSFSAREKLEYYKKKWQREHVARFVLCGAAWLVLLFSLLLRHVQGELVGTALALLALVFYIALYNQMMCYAEAHTFGPYRDGREPDSDS